MSSRMPTQAAWTNEKEDILLNRFSLHRACRDGDLRSLLTIFTAGDERPDVTVEDSYYGWTPAHWAAYFGKLVCLQYLMTEAGVSVDISTSQFNQTACHLSSFACYPHCLQWLMEAGCNVNEQDYLGETPLHKAARSGSVECISRLLSYSPQLALRNHAGQTAADVAEVCGYSECSKYLNQLSDVQLHPPKGIHQDLIPPVYTTPPLDLIRDGPSSSVCPPGSLPRHEGNGDAPVTMDIDEGATQYNGNDVMLMPGAADNLLAVGGKKRTREDQENICWKKIKLGGFGVDQLCDATYDTYWQSDGPQPHLVNVQFRRKTLIHDVCVYADYKSDESYTPNRISVRVGNNFNDLLEIEQVELTEPQGWIRVALNTQTGKPVKTFMIQIAVLANHQNGRDTHVRRIKIRSPGNTGHFDMSFPEFKSIDCAQYSCIR